MLDETGLNPPQHGARKLGERAGKINPTVDHVFVKPHLNTACQKRAHARQVDGAVDNFLVESEEALGERLKRPHNPGRVKFVKPEFICREFVKGFKALDDPLGTLLLSKIHPRR